MKLVLFDDSTKASERVRRLEAYQPEHVRTIYEFVGMTPDLVLMDESVTPETANELLQWGISVCLLAERVTIALRRKFPMLKDMVTDRQVMAYLEERFADEQEHPEDLETITNVPVSQPEANAFTPSKGTLAPVISPPVPSNPLSPMSRRAHIVGFVSLRDQSGGAGKSGVAFNYAAYARKQGSRVLVVDVDPKGPFGKLAHAEAGLTTEHWCNLMTQQQGSMMTERAVLDNVERQQPYGFDIITSSGRHEVLKQEQLRWILEQTAPYFDYVFVDMPAAWDMVTLETMRVADEVLLFGQYDPFQYEDYRESIQTVTNPIVGGMTQEHVTVVIGRGHFGRNWSIELEEVKRQLGVDKVWFIPEDPLYPQYRNQHKAVVLEHPSAPCAKAMRPLFETHESERSFGSNLPALYEPVQKGFWLSRLLGSKSKPHKKSKRKGVAG